METIPVPDTRADKSQPAAKHPSHRAWAAGGSSATPCSVTQPVDSESQAHAVAQNYPASIQILKYLTWILIF